MSKLPWTRTSQPSAPCRSRIQPCAAANGLRLSSCHIAHARRGSVDVDRRALDPVVAAGAAQDVVAADQYLAGTGQRDAGVAALENDLPLGPQHEALRVVDLRNDRLGGTRRRCGGEPDDT